MGFSLECRAWKRRIGALAGGRGRLALQELNLTVQCVCVGGEVWGVVAGLEPQCFLRFCGRDWGFLS